MMSSTLKKKLLPAAMAVAMASGVAFSGSASAVHLAEDGIGQVLTGPMYLAIPGYSTKFAIVNTRSDTAVKAKVVLRSQLTSAEVLDFICYLTPGDVCRFEIQNINGQAVLVSDDDSIKSSATTFASMPGAALVGDKAQLLFDENLGTGDINEIGHVEVIGVYGVRGNIQTGVNSGVVQIFRGMSKIDLAKVFDTPRSQLDALNGAEDPGVGRLSGGVCQATPVRDGGEACVASGTTVAAAGGLIRSTDPTWVRLLGYAEMVNADTADRIGYRIPALAGEIWDNIPPTGTIPTGDFDGRVISNSSFDANVAVETGVGAIFGGIRNGINLGAYDNIIELEHAMATTNIKGSFEDDLAGTGGVNRTQVVVTFPTKYRHLQNVCNVAGIVLNTQAGEQYFPPFEALGPVQYQLTSFDNQENNISIAGNVFSGGPAAAINRLPAEVNYFLPAWPATTASSNFESGWFDMSLIPEAGCSYNGVPTISYSHKYQLLNGAIANSWFIANGHTPELANRDAAPTPPSGQ